MKLGEQVPDFELPGVDGRTYCLADFADAKVLVVAQLCNHCPYVVGYQQRLNDLARRLAPAGVAVVGVNSNDASHYPSDSFQAMRIRAAEVQMPFPYLHDETQSFAKALGAQRTPELFVFDGTRRLAYHGALDDNLEEPEQVEHAYLADAIAAVLAGGAPDPAETRALGCTVKWRE